MFTPSERPPCDGFQCSSGQCIDNGMFFSFISTAYTETHFCVFITIPFFAELRCDSVAHCYDKTDEMKCGKFFPRAAVQILIVWLLLLSLLLAKLIIFLFFCCRHRRKLSVSKWFSKLWFRPMHSQRYGKIAVKLSFFSLANECNLLKLFFYLFRILVWRLL